MVCSDSVWMQVCKWERGRGVSRGFFRRTYSLLYWFYLWKQNYVSVWEHSVFHVWRCVNAECKTAGFETGVTFMVARLFYTFLTITVARLYRLPFLIFLSWLEASFSVTYQCFLLFVTYSFLLEGKSYIHFIWSLEGGSVSRDSSYFLMPPSLYINSRNLKGV